MTTLTHPPDTDVAQRRRGVRAFVAVTGAGVASAVLLASVDPNYPGHYPTCPFLFITSEFCPGCGSLRAVHDLLHLDLGGALARNPLTVLLVPYLLFAGVSWGLRVSGRRAPHPTSIPPVLIWGLLGVVLTYWVLRNVPGWTWLSPL